MQKILKPNREREIKMRKELEKLEEPVRADGWRNLFFFTDGKSYPGGHVWSTEEAARAATKILEESDNAFVETCCGEVYLKSEYSHAIQMPVKA
jgi:hypothetical protein